MTIKMGDSLPEGKLLECTEFDTETGCPMNPQVIDPAAIAKDKKIVLFGVPGAYTPTCSAKHLPGFIQAAQLLKQKGVDEIWCLAVNDHFVMASWGRDQGVSGKVRMLADGSAEYTRALGLDRDLSANGMGVRCHRFAIIADHGVVRYIGIEATGKFEVSNAEAILAAL